MNGRNGHPAVHSDEPDARRILLAQAARGVVYGLGSIVIGVSLEKSGLSTTQVGLVFTAMLAGVALASIVLARYGDRIGRRRAYRPCSSVWPARASSSRSLTRSRC